MLPKISIIVPVYNASPWLRRCLESLIHQTLKDIEFLCVNDASTDGSLAILHEFSQMDARVRVIDLPTNRGEAGARNAAFSNVRGEYIGFLDSDDSLDLDFCEKLYAKAKTCDAEISRGMLRSIWEDREYDSINHDLITQNKHHFIYDFPAAIYKSKFLRRHDINFPQGITCGADLLFLVKAVTQVQTLVFVDDVYYNYHRRIDSANATVLNMKGITSLIFVAHASVDYLNSFGVDQESYLIPFTERFNTLAGLCSRAAPEERASVSVLLAENCIQLYAKCSYKYAFLKSYPFHAHAALQKGDAVELAERLLHTSAPVYQAQRMAAALRARVAVSKKKS